MGEGNMQGVSLFPAERKGSPIMSEERKKDSGASRCSAVLVRRLTSNAPRRYYWKVYVAGEALHEDHDREEWAEEQAARLRLKLSKQNKEIVDT
jgi:hypothetical protein